MGNRYLEGNFGPVSDEVTVTELTVTGTIPDYLDGRYLRNGPNPIGADPATYHWFTGFGMVHACAFATGARSGTATATSAAMPLLKRSARTRSLARRSTSWTLPRTPM